MSALTRKKLLALFDARAITFLVGIALGGAGGAMLSVPWTLVAIGALLTFKAVR